MPKRNHSSPLEFPTPNFHAGSRGIHVDLNLKAQMAPDMGPSLFFRDPCWDYVHHEKVLARVVPKAHIDSQ